MARVGLDVIPCDPARTSAERGVAQLGQPARDRQATISLGAGVPTLIRDARQAVGTTQLERAAREGTAQPAVAADESGGKTPFGRTIVYGLLT